MPPYPASHTGVGKRATVDDFEIGRFLGRGKYGLVYLAREQSSKLVVALKVLYKSYIKSERVEGQVRRELDIHLNVRHINIIRLYTWFQDETRVFLVLEVAPYGELYQRLQQFGKFPLPVVSKIIRDVAQAIQYLHKKNIFHRDLKAENILICKGRESRDNVEVHNSDDSLSTHDHELIRMANYTYKIADFGWSVHHPAHGGRRRTQCGTLDYLPPEVMLGQSYDKACDIWSLGALCYELICGTAPFYHDEIKITRQNIANVEYSFTKDFSPASKDFIQRMLVRSPEARISIEDILRHPFLKQTEPRNKISK